MDHLVCHRELWRDTYSKLRKCLFIRSFISEKNMNNWACLVHSAFNFYRLCRMKLRHKYDTQYFCDSTKKNIFIHFQAKRRKRKQIFVILPPLLQTSYATLCFHTLHQFTTYFFISITCYEILFWLALFGWPYKGIFVSPGTLLMDIRQERKQ